MFLYLLLPTWAEDICLQKAFDNHVQDCYVHSALFNRGVVVFQIRGSKRQQNNNISILTSTLIGFNKGTRHQIHITGIMIDWSP